MYFVITLQMVRISLEFIGAIVGEERDPGVCQAGVVVQQQQQQQQPALHEMNWLACGGGNTVVSEGLLQALDTGSLSQFAGQLLNLDGQGQIESNPVDRQGSVDTVQPSTSDGQGLVEGGQSSSIDRGAYIGVAHSSTSDGQSHTDNARPSTSDGRGHVEPAQPSTSDGRGHVQSPQPSTSQGQEQHESTRLFVWNTGKSVCGSSMCKCVSTHYTGCQKHRCPVKKTSTLQFKILSGIKVAPRSHLFGDCLLTDHDKEEILNKELRQLHARRNDMIERVTTRQMRLTEQLLNSYEGRRVEQQTGEGRSGLPLTVMQSRLAAFAREAANEIEDRVSNLTSIPSPVNSVWGDDELLRASDVSDVNDSDSESVVCDSGVCGVYADIDWQNVTGTVSDDAQSESLLAAAARHVGVDGAGDSDSSESIDCSPSPSKKRKQS